MLKITLSTAALLLATALPATAQTCYTDSSGDIVDLGSMCNGPSEDRTQPSSAQSTAPVTDSNGFVRNVAATPFPAYLFDGNSSNDTAHQTGQASRGNSALFVYDSRYVLRFVEWPHTASSTNHAEWGYVDCSTGWRGLDSHPFTGSSEPFFVPPNRTGNLDAYRSLCIAARVTPRF